MPDKEYSKSLPLLTVVGELLHFQVPFIWQKFQRPASGERKQTPDPLPHERLPVSQRAASRRLSSLSGPSDQDVWVRK